MKTITTTLQDRIILAGTVFSGLMFLVCVSIMYTNYRPFLGDEAELVDANGRFVSEMKGSYASLEAQLKNLPEEFVNSFSFRTVKAENISNTNVSEAVGNLIKVGERLLMINR